MTRLGLLPKEILEELSPTSSFVLGNILYCLREIFRKKTLDKHNFSPYLCRGENKKNL